MSRVDEQKKLAVWSKAHIIQGYDPTVYRHDDFGRTIRYADFRHPSQYGWDIFPIHPIPLFSITPTSHLPVSDLRPLRWSSEGQWLNLFFKAARPIREGRGI
jgi:hypothetical protein